MSYGQMLLGNAMDAAFSPGQLHFDPNTNQITDANGNPYHPSVLARMFSPTAANVYALQNTRGALAGQEAYNTRKIVQGLTGIDDKTYGQTYDPRFSPTNVNTQQQAVQAGLLGVPRTQAETQLNQALAARQQAANEANRASVASLLGTPALSAGVENQGLNYQSGEYSGQTALQPQKFYNLGLGMGNEAQQLLGQRAALPYQSAELLNRSQIGAGMSGQQLQDLPINAGTQRLQDIGANWQASVMPDISRQYPFQANVTTEGVSPSTGLNPNYVSPMMLQNAALQNYMSNGGIMGASEVTGAPSGTDYHIPNAPRVVTPTVGTVGSNPSDMGRAPTPAETYAKEKADEVQQQLDDLHGKHQASVSARIAELKALQAKLKEEHAHGATPASLIGQTLGKTALQASPTYWLGKDAANLIGRGYNYLTSPLY